MACDLGVVINKHHIVLIILNMHLPIGEGVLLPNLEEVKVLLEGSLVQEDQNSLHLTFNPQPKNELIVHDFRLG